jgi:hypothetical protein
VFLTSEVPLYASHRHGAPACARQPPRLPVLSETPSGQVDFDDFDLVDSIIGVSPCQPQERYFSASYSTTHRLLLAPQTSYLRHEMKGYLAH